MLCESISGVPSEYYHSYSTNTSAWNIQSLLVAAGEGGTQLFFWIGMSGVEPQNKATAEFILERIAFFFFYRFLACAVLFYSLEKRNCAWKKKKTGMQQSDEKVLCV